MPPEWEEKLAMGKWTRMQCQSFGTLQGGFRACDPGEGLFRGDPVGVHWCPLAGEKSTNQPMNARTSIQEIAYA
jgi:hypothetical protein